MNSRVSQNSIDFKTKLSVKKQQKSPLRSIYCLKNRSKLKEIEKKEDCFILDYNPDDICVSNNKNAASADISVVAEKGQVALRDFPHSRHNCAKYPFTKTDHESCCKLCYCFVCDGAAPCVSWASHCHATDNEIWKLQRRRVHKAHEMMQELRKAKRMSK